MGSNPLPSSASQAETGAYRDGSSIWISHGNTIFMKYSPENVNRIFRKAILFRKLWLFSRCPRSTPYNFLMSTDSGPRTSYGKCCFTTISILCRTENFNKNIKNGFFPSKQSLQFGKQLFISGKLIVFCNYHLFFKK